MRLKGGEDLRRGVGREEQALQLRLDKIPLLRAQRIEVGLQQHLEGAQVDEIADLHHLQQGFLIDNAVKDLPQGVVIAPFGGRGDPDHQRPVGMPGPAILQDAPVGGGRGMVRFVNDDGLKIRHETGQPGAAAQGLHTGHDGWGGMLVARRLHDPQGQGGINQAQFVHGLLDELIAVRQDEGPATVPLDQKGKDNGFARSRGQHEQGPADPTRRGGEEGGHGFILVGAGHQTECGRQWRNSLDHACSHRAKRRASARSAMWHHRLHAHVCLT
jgi:hypothetical protein